jgi:NADPH:quinone reductase-like Zn-dependent oxidoreductase
MRAAYITTYGGAAVLKLGVLAEPQIAPDELLVEVHAAGLNPIDFKVREGKLKALFAYPMPLTLGQEVSGVVRSAGAQCQRFKPGDAVFGRFDKQRFGGLADFCALRDADAAPKPVKLSHVEAASLPLVALTSWQALVEIGQIKPGSRVLIHAGSGGVGTAAIQIAKSQGAWVATTCGSRNAELVRQLGADLVIDYARERFEAAVRDLDVVFDTVGGETTFRSLKTLKPGGVLVDIVNPPTPDVAQASGANIAVRGALWTMALRRQHAAKRAGVRYAYLFMRADGARLTAISALADDGKIVPVIDAVFPFEKAREAFARIESGRTTGKIVIDMRAVAAP